MRAYSVEPLSSRPAPIRKLLARIAALVLITAFAAGSLPQGARAEATDKRMESLTKSTIYGALLGGLLGLTSALVVKDSSRDDVIRWGIAIGAFSGFAYGIFSFRNEPDRFSGGPDGIFPVGTGLRGARPVGRDPAGEGGRDRIHVWKAGERGFFRFPEVGHDGFEEEGSKVEKIGAPPFAGLGEVAGDITSPGGEPCRRAALDAAR